MDKDIEYEKEKAKIKDCSPDEYEAEIREICEKLKY